MAAESRRGVKDEGSHSQKHKAAAPRGESAEADVPVGGLVLAADEVVINAGRPTKQIKVRNTGDRPIQVGSHYHFFEVNRYLEFDRAAAFGMRLDIPATTAIRFEPGDEKDVVLVPYSGKRHVYGFNNLVNGWTGDGPAPGYQPNLGASIRRARDMGFKSSQK